MGTLMCSYAFLYTFKAFLYTFNENNREPIFLLLLLTVVRSVRLASIVHDQDYYYHYLLQHYL